MRGIIVFIALIVMAVYNFPFMTSDFGIISFIFAFAITFLISIKMIHFKNKDIAAKVFFVLGIFELLLFFWETILFFILVYHHYCASIVTPFLLKTIKALNNNGCIGLIGALIGGLCSIIAVRITITSERKKYVENNIDHMAPKIILTTTAQNIDRIIGYGKIKTDGKNVYGNSVFYFTNIGQEAVNIRFKALEETEFSVSWGFERDKQIYNDFSYFPMLRKGDAVEISIPEGLSVFDFRIEFSDALFNRYKQSSTIHNRNQLSVPPLPQFIERERSRTSLWEKILSQELFDNTRVQKEKMTDIRTRKRNKI